MDEDRPTIDPPVYLIGKMYSCWRCGAKMPVVAILDPKVEGTAGEICILSEITELPEAVLAYIQGRVPTFKLKFSKTIEQKYSASTCPKCGVLSGDSHLHSEPGAPFFPTDDREAASLYMTELPVPGRIQAPASIGMGCGDWIPRQHLKALKAIERRRTADLGYHLDECMDCGDHYGTNAQRLSANQR